jgi:hypothetical protein
MTNSYMSYFNRILEQAERKEIIDKLPYIRGGAGVKITALDRQEAKKNQPGIIQPAEYGYINLGNLTRLNLEPKRAMIYQDIDCLIAVLLLTTGMRPKELNYIYRESIQPFEGIRYTFADGIEHEPMKCVMEKQEKQVYTLAVFNHKILAHIKDPAYIDRKVILLPPVVDMLGEYISFMKEQHLLEDDQPIFSYCIGRRNGEVINARHHNHAIHFVYRHIQVMKNFYERYNALQLTGSMPLEEQVEKIKTAFLEAHKLDDKMVKQEMRVKNIRPYSFRHSFFSLLSGIVKDEVISYVTGHIDGAVRASAHVNYFLPANGA